MATRSNPLDQACERLSGLLLDLAKPCQRAAEAVLRVRTAALPYPAESTRALAAATDALSDSMQASHDELVAKFSDIANDIASVEKSLKGLK